MAVREKVLVVNDEPSIRMYLRTLLEAAGFDVQVVSSGMEALGKITTTKSWVLREISSLSLTEQAQFWAPSNL